MKLTLEPTGTIEKVSGSPHRIWKGTTDKGVRVVAWISVVQPQTHDKDVNEEFARELREVRADRNLVSFDMRIID